MRRVFQRYSAVVDKIPSLPLCVLGVGFYRAWTETVYVNNQYSFPAQEIGSLDLYNLFIILFLVVLALASKRIAPLCKVSHIFTITGVLFFVSTLLNFASVFWPEHRGLMGLPAVLCGAAGISLIILLWSEYYGCISPFRTAFYFSASVLFGALVLWIFKGLLFWWVFAGALILPLASLLSLKRSLSLLDEDERPHKSWGDFSFPWKPVLLVAAYSFAYGLRESLYYDSVLGPHSSFGVVVPSVMILVSVIFRRRKLSFTGIWKCALVLMLVSLLPIDLGFPLTQEFFDVCALASYTACLILIMVVFSNLCYRYGVCALWIFAIERATRLAAATAGQKVDALVGSYFEGTPADIIFSVAVALLVIIATLVVLSEKELSSRWGIILTESPANEAAVLEKNRLGVKCHELARQFELSEREEEVLLLLALKRKRSTIENELFIATSTYKTHVRHIYQKLGIHSRTALYDVLGIEE